MKSLLLAILFGLMMVGCGEEAKEDAVQEDAVQEDAVQEDAVQEDETKNESAINLGENFTVPDINLEMIWVKPGTFMMGSPTSEAGRYRNETQHQVTLTKGYYLGKYEVTQAQWERVMGNNPSHFKGADPPVENVSLNDAVEFCKKLTKMEKNAGRVPQGMSYQLPTEAQWEYACRAGTTTKYSWGDDINPKLAYYTDSGPKKPTAVGSYRPNPWGFFDMHGNVYEWTADWYQAAYPTGNPVVDPTGPASGSWGVLRGGSWYDDGAGLRSARRLPYYLGNPTMKIFGFRVSFQKSKE